jgi:hypothetical protein
MIVRTLSPFIEKNSKQGQPVLKIPFTQNSLVLVIGL